MLLFWVRKLEASAEDSNLSGPGLLVTRGKPLLSIKCIELLSLRIIYSVIMLLDSRTSSAESSYMVLCCFELASRKEPCGGVFYSRD